MLAQNSQDNHHEHQQPRSGPEAIRLYCQSGGRATDMSERPEYYSGRGVTESDLGVPQLVAIYRGLVRDFGLEAGDAFCRMVNSLANMSATNFLNQFYSFFANDRTWETPAKESGIDLGPEGDSRLGVGFATIIETLAPRSRREDPVALGESIKQRFFQHVEWTGFEPAGRISEDTTIESLKVGQWGFTTSWAGRETDEGLVFSAEYHISSRSGGTLDTPVFKESEDVYVVKRPGVPPMRARLKKQEG